MACGLMNWRHKACFLMASWHMTICLKISSHGVMSHDIVFICLLSHDLISNDLVSIDLLHHDIMSHGLGSLAILCLMPSHV